MIKLLCLIYYVIYRCDRDFKATAKSKGGGILISVHSTHGIISIQVCSLRDTKNELFCALPHRESLCKNKRGLFKYNNNDIKSHCWKIDHVVNCKRH